MSNDLVMSSDTPMHRTTILEMNDEQLTECVVNRRERRLRAVKIHAEAVRLETESRHTKLNADLKKQCEMFEKDMATIDKAMDRMEKRAIKIMTIKNELGKGTTNGSQGTRDTGDVEGESRSGGDPVHVCDGGGQHGPVAAVDGVEPDVRQDG